jgi:hypothetical protein
VGQALGPVLDAQSIDLRFGDFNGWDGLTTNSFSFVNLFKDFEDVDVKSRVFDVEDREFYEVDVKVAVSLFAGDLSSTQARRSTLPKSRRSTPSRECCRFP